MAKVLPLQLSMMIHPFCIGVAKEMGLSQGDPFQV